MGTRQRTSRAIPLFREWQPPRGADPALPRPIRLTFEKGIDQSLTPSMLSDGLAGEVVNWEVMPTGGLRARDRLQTFRNDKSTQSGVLATAYPTTRRKIRSLYSTWHRTAAGENYQAWIVALSNPNNANATELWAIRDDQANGWAPLGTHSGVSEAQLADQPFAFATGLNSGNNVRVLWTHPDIAEINAWDGEFAPPGVAAQTSSTPGRALAYFKNRFFSGGSNSNPYRLHFTEQGKTDAWDTASGGGSIDIARDSSAPIEDLAEWQGMLIIGKRNGCHLLTGDDVQNFSVTKIMGTDCARGRALVPTPYGLVIQGRRNIYFWKGGDPDIISKPVEQFYLAGRSGWRSGAYIDGKVYLSGSAMSRILVFDLHAGVWWTERTTNANTYDSFPWALYALDNRLGMGPSNTTLSGVGPMLYRDVPPLSSERQPDSYTNLGYEEYTLETPRIFLQEVGPFTLRHVYIRLRQRGNSVSEAPSEGGPVTGDPMPITGGMTITPIWDGVTGTSHYVNPIFMGDGRVRVARIDVFNTVQSFQLRLQQNVLSTDNVVWDVESITLVGEVEPLR